MIHARSDYQHIQDGTGKIPNDEPVFLLRAKDALAPDVIREWADQAEAHEVDPVMVKAALDQADAMEAYARIHGSKMPDL